MNIDRARMFDLRVVQRNIASGRITKDEYGGWLSALPNVVENIQDAREGGDDDGYDPTPPAEEGATSSEGAGDPAAPAAAMPAPAPAAPAPAPGPAPAAAPAPAPATTADPANDPQSLG